MGAQPSPGVTFVDVSEIHEPEDRHDLVKGPKPILPRDGEREEARVPRVRRPGVDERTIPAFDHPAPDTDEPEIDQTHEQDQPMKALRLGDTTRAQGEPTALPVTKHGLDPHPPTPATIGLPGRRQQIFGVALFFVSMKQ